MGASVPSGLIQSFLVFNKSNPLDSSFKPFYMAPHGRFPAVPHESPAEGTCWGGDRSESARATECTRRGESASGDHHSPQAAPS